VITAQYDLNLYIKFQLMLPFKESARFMKKWKGSNSSNIYIYIYRVIHKSLRNFRTRLRNNQDIHGRKEHINR